jgi:hypothetical protein
MISEGGGGGKSLGGGGVDVLGGGGGAKESGGGGGGDGALPFISLGGGGIESPLLLPSAYVAILRVYESTGASRCEDKRPVAEECGLKYGALSSRNIYEAKKGD